MIENPLMKSAPSAQGARKKPLAIVGPLRGRLDALHVGADLRLREREGGADLAGRHLRQPEQAELLHLLDDRLVSTNWRTISVIAFCSSVFSM